MEDEKQQEASQDTAQGFARSTAEERAAAVETIRPRQLSPDELAKMTTREKLERGLTVREDVSASTDHEPNLKWVGIDDGKGGRARKDDPPRSLHIGPLDIFFDEGALAALTGGGVYSEHAQTIITSVAGFKRVQEKGE